MTCRALSIVSLVAAAVMLAPAALAEVVGYPINSLTREEVPNILRKMRNPPRMGRARMAEIVRNSGHRKAGGYDDEKWQDLRALSVEMLAKCDLIFPVTMRAFENHATGLKEPLEEALKAEVRFAVEHPKTAGAWDDCLASIDLALPHFTALGRPYWIFSNYLTDMQLKMKDELDERTRRRPYSPSPAERPGSGAAR